MRNGPLAKLPNWSRRKNPIFRLAGFAGLHTIKTMFSHTVIFWTDHANANAADELLVGIDKYLRSIPGILHFSAGKMVPSHREVVDKSYQVGLSIVFLNAKAQEDYQAHPQHLEFIHTVFKKTCKKVRVYDFE